MYCISNGIDYHGMKTKKGIVIYIAGESERKVKQIGVLLRNEGL